MLAQNLMVGKGDHLRICDYGLAGDCHMRADDPWVPGKEHRDGRLIYAPFTGGTATYMSEELATLRRELEAAATQEDYRHVKEKKPATAATTDIVAAALVAFELYSRSDRWRLIENLGIDGGAVREMVRTFATKPALEEVKAWGAAEVATWLGRSPELSKHLQPMALEGRIDSAALLDAALTGDLRALLPSAKAGLVGRWRVVSRELPTLVMPPALLAAVEMSLHAEVGRRPRDAKAMTSGGFREFCRNAIHIEHVQVRTDKFPFLGVTRPPRTGGGAHGRGETRHADADCADPTGDGRLGACFSGAARVVWRLYLAGCVRRIL